MAGVTKKSLLFMVNSHYVSNVQGVHCIGQVKQNCCNSFTGQTRQRKKGKKVVKL